MHRRCLKSCRQWPLVTGVSPGALNSPTQSTGFYGEKNAHQDYEKNRAPAKHLLFTVCSLTGDFV
jgi:hypothetical protein